jgi:hypothetical protein
MNMKGIRLLQIIATLMVTMVGSAFAQARFTPNGDGTITDNTTCLMWEMKTGVADDSGCPEEIGHGHCGQRCSSTQKCDDVHDVNNRYQWSQGKGRDGGAFTDFLGALNNATSSDGQATTGCFANHCDWRLPNIGELRTIQAPGQNAIIDPVFGPTAHNLYWSASANSGNDRVAWSASFAQFTPGGNRFKLGYDSVRAVRGPILNCPPN